MKIRLVFFIGLILLLVCAFTYGGQWVELKKHYMTIPFDYTKGDTIYVYAADSSDAIKRLGIKVWRAN